MPFLTYPALQGKQNQIDDLQRRLEGALADVQRVKAVSICRFFPVRYYAKLRQLSPKRKIRRFCKLAWIKRYLHWHSNRRLFSLHHLRERSSGYLISCEQNAQEAQKEKELLAEQLLKLRGEHIHQLNAMMGKFVPMDDSRRSQQKLTLGGADWQTIFCYRAFSRWTKQSMSLIVQPTWVTRLRRRNMSSHCWRRRKRSALNSATAL